MFSELPLCSFLEGFFHTSSSKLFFCTSWSLLDYSTKVNYIKYFTSKVDNLSCKWDATSGSKGEKLIILLESIDTFEIHDCCCFDTPIACGSTDDLP